MCSSLQLKSCISQKSEKKRQNRTLSVIKPVTIKLETQSLESVDFTITTWKNELQDKLVETSYRLNETIVEKKH